MDRKQVEANVGIVYGSFLLLVVGLALAATGCCPTCPASPISEAEDYPVPFCRVIGENGNSPSRTLCSGTLVDRTASWGLVVTCHHCTGSGPYRVRFINGDEHVANLVATDAQHDLAALRIESPRVAPIQCGAFTGEGVYRSYGFGGDGKFSVVEGRVVERYGTIGSTGHSYAGISGVPVSGDSGSGVVNEAGEFVGVLWGHRTDKAEGLVTMGKPVSDFLRRLVADFKWTPSASFTPGGMPVYDATNVDTGVRVAEQKAEGQSRTLIDSAGNEVEVALCGLFGGSGCPPSGCLPPRRKDPPGRRPIENPIESVPPRGDLDLGPVTFRGDVTLIWFAIVAACVAAGVGYTRQYSY